MDLRERWEAHATEGLHGRVLLGMIVTGAFIATNSYKSFRHRDIERLILAAAKGGSRDT